MSPPSIPPRFVPTLTEVVKPTSVTGEPSLLKKTAEASVIVDELGAQLAQRVLQRINLLLEQRLQEAIGQLIVEHTQTLMPRLCQEIEKVVRNSVDQAFEQETGQTTAQT
jgi:hypothetical protein